MATGSPGRSRARASAARPASRSSGCTSANACCRRPTNRSVVAEDRVRRGGGQNSVGIDHREEVRRVPHERPDVRFAAEQRILGVELFGHVACDGDKATDCRVVAHVGQHALDPAPRSAVMRGCGTRRFDATRPVGTARSRSPPLPRPRDGRGSRRSCRAAERGRTPGSRAPTGSTKTIWPPSSSPSAMSAERCINRRNRSSAWRSHSSDWRCWRSRTPTSSGPSAPSDRKRSCPTRSGSVENPMAIAPRRGDVAHERDQPDAGEALPPSDLAELDGFVGQVVDGEDHRLFEVVDELGEPAATSGHVRGDIRRHPGRFPDVGDREVTVVVGHEHDPTPTADEVGGALQRVLDGHVDVEIGRGDDQAAEVGHVLFRVATTDVHRRVAQQHEHLVEAATGESALTIRTVAARHVLRFPDVVHDGARVERALHVLDDPRRDLGTEQIADARGGPSGAAGPAGGRLAVDGRRRAGVEQGSVPGHVQEDVGAARRRGGRTGEPVASARRARGARPP